MTIDVAAALFNLEGVTESIVVDGRRLIDAGASPHGASRTEAHARCARLFALKYLATDEERGQSAPAPGAPLGKGILAHVGLAHWYEWMRWQAMGRSYSAFAVEYYSPLEAIEVRAERLVNVDGCAYADVKAWKQLTIAACKAYVDRYSPGGIAELFEVVGVEMLFTIPAEVMAEVTGYSACPPFTTRIDLVVRDKAGRVFWWDHKSTATELSAKRYTLSGGVLSKEWFGRQIYRERWGGVKINMVGWRDARPKNQPDGTKSFDVNDASFKFERFSTEPAPFAVSRWPHDYAGHWRRLRAIEAGLVPLGTEGGRAARVRALLAAGRDGDALALATATEEQIETMALDTKVSPWHYPGTDSEQACETKYGPCEMLKLCCWGPPVAGSSSSSPK